MSRLRQFASRLRRLFGGRRLDQDFEEEISAHLDMLAEENVRRGMTVEEARLAARRRFGGVEQTRLAYRDQRGFPIVDALVQDVRFGFRMMRKNPGFTAVALLTLALGIGANTAIFSVLDAVMIENLPVSNPRQLVMLKWTAKDWPAVVEDLEGSIVNDPDGGGTTSESITYPVYQTLRERNSVFSETFAFSSNQDGFNVQCNGKSELALSQTVSGSYFSGLGVRTILGRPILPEDDSEVAPPVAVVSYRFWKSKLGGDESAVGASIIVNAIPMTVIGVGPPEFYGTQPGNSVDLWVTIHAYPRLLQSVTDMGPGQSGGDAAATAAAYWQNSTTWWLVVMGRLKPGVSEGRAEGELRSIFDQSLDSLIKSEKMAENRPTLKTAPGDQGMDELRRHFSKPLLVLMCAVGLVLLIACANVAGLLLARATARQREIAVRLSLGAHRLRLVQQLLTESLLLAVLGAALGLLLARWFGELLVALVASGRSSITLSLDVNPRVLLFTAGAALLTGVLFGLAPALSASRMSLANALKDGSSAGRIAGRRSMLSKVLVSAQVALSLMLLVGAGLFLRTLAKLESVPLGFERDRLLLFSVAPGLNGYTGQRLAQYYRDVQARIASIPGVRSVSFSAHGPIGGGSSSSSISLPDVPDKQRFELHRHLVGPGYFDVLGIPTLMGRVLNEHDDMGAPKVAVVNRTLALQAFGENNPLGKMLRFGGKEHPSDFEIVGVVGDARYNDLRQPPPPTAYFSHLQSLDVSSFMTFQIRTNSDPESIMPAVRGEVAQVDADIPVSKVETLDHAIDRTLMFERLFSRLTGYFGLLALVLVCVGLYGTMSYFVARRTNEIGIRIALGARPAGVFRMVVSEGLKLTLAGVAVGLGGAAAGTSLISSVLYEVRALDPLTFAGAAALLVAIGLFACYVPARRAMKVDPLVALRYE